MLPQPTTIETLPRWFAIMLEAFSRFVPGFVRDAIDDFMRETVWPLELDERISLNVRHDIQALADWWTRIRRGEEGWSDFMREIAEDVRRFQQ